MTRMPLTFALAAVLLAGCAATSGDTGEDAAPMPNFPGQLAPDVEPTVTDPHAPLVAFYGDSYTLGTGAFDRAHRWSSIICTDRGWNEFNPSVNGIGFVNNRRDDIDLPEQVIAVDPDIVFVTMGLNDNFSYSSAADEIHSTIDADLQHLKAELPDASHWIEGHPEWMGADGLHPNDDGYAEMARQMDDALNGIGL